MASPTSSPPSRPPSATRSMDEHTFEVDRIKKCCTHYALPDGRLMPGCAYNMFYRHKDPRFTRPKGLRTRIPVPTVPSST
jgi:hypothetical protein